MNFTLKVVIYLALALITIYFGFAYPNYFLGVILGTIMGVMAWYMSEDIINDD